MNHRQSTSRSVGAVTSSICHLVSITRSTKPDEMLLYNKDFEFGTAVLDSHADTCDMNDTAYILEYTGVTAEVAPFSHRISQLLRRLLHMMMLKQVKF